MDENKYTLKELALCTNFIFMTLGIKIIRYVDNDKDKDNNLDKLTHNIEQNITYSNNFDMISYESDKCTCNIEYTITKNTNLITFKFTNDSYVISLSNEQNNYYHEIIFNRPNSQSTKCFIEQNINIILDPNCLIDIIKEYFNNLFTDDYKRKIIRIIYSEQFLHYSSYNIINSSNDKSYSIYQLSEDKVKKIKFFNSVGDVLLLITFDLDSININEELNKQYHLNNCININIDKLSPIIIPNFDILMFDKKSILPKNANE